ncbi:MAG: hypothetical protein JNK58_09050 [Phycisphaerae bacterium]|nr:hypothetical protein [Phycisphaerae bacterium]
MGRRTAADGVPMVASERAWLGKKVSRVMPRTREELSRWVQIVLGVEATGSALLDGSDAPLDYLEWAFFGCVGGVADGRHDCVVWASRGGGKTLYAAVATVLDLVFRAGIEVKVLGGSREQSQRMHAHLRRFFERPGLSELVDGKFGERRGRLRNGSSVEVLAQSERSVRGTRPQKLRCDEVELFDEEVWSAAQLVTRSKRCGRGEGRVLVRGSVEALSTCHRPPGAGGLMSRLIDSSKASASMRLFKWTAIDVLERCPAERVCDRCELFEDCGGRAKNRPSAGSCGGRGHFLIDDAVTMKRRSGREAWASEMLCKRPMRRGAVFPEFDPAVHVFGVEGTGGELIAGMDFGFRSPTAIVWAVVEAGVVRVVDERVESGALLEEHVRALLERGAGIVDGGAASGERRVMPRWIGVDPAGSQRSYETGRSPIGALRGAGLVVRARRSTIEEGLRVIRSRLAPAIGPPTLLVHERCVRLIECLMNYRYSEDVRRLTPLKDGHDHAVDALRYMLTNVDAADGVGVKRY